ncbi:MAG TPA: hypothetical protein VG710_04215 [Opitutus sp.]|nr:hypothetical protein [Opitutus sp.]
MAQAIRVLGLKLLAWLNRLLAGPRRTGWQRSTRPADDLSGK